MTPRANIIWWTLLIGLSIALVCVVRSQTLLLGWTPCAGAENYRVFAGPTSRGWDTNWATTNTATTFDIPGIGRWYFVVRAERGEFNTTNYALSAMSDEVSFELLPQPQIGSESYVRLTVLMETSDDLLNWRGMTSAPTWLAATGQAGFFRNPTLNIEAAKLAK